MTLLEKTTSVGLKIQLEQSKQHLRPFDIDPVEIETSGNLVQQNKPCLLDPLGHPFSVSAGRPRLVLNSLRFARACPGVKRFQVLQGSTQTSHYSVEIPQNYRTFAACLIPAKWVAFNDPCSLGKPKYVSFL